MGKEYIGARYVPKFMGTYDNTQAYEALCVVDTGLGTSYITKVPTPAGTPLTNTTYWTVYGASSGAIINLQNQIDDITKIGVTPQMYGAKADGMTDDTQAIQDALDNNKTVFLPYSANPYIITGIRLNAGNRLIGMGGTLKYKDNTAVDNTVSYYIINAMNNDVLIDGINVDGNGANNTQFLVCDIITISGNHSRVRNCYLYNSPDSGIMYSSGIDSECRNNIIDGGTDSGIYANANNYGDNEACIIEGNIISNFGASGIACKRYYAKSIINNNIVHDCVKGITMEQASTPTDYATENSVSNNYIYNVPQYGIDLRGGEDHTVIGNTIRDCDYMAFINEGAKKVTFVGNVIIGGTNAQTNPALALIYITNRDSYGADGIVVNGNTIEINNNVVALRCIGDTDNVIFEGNYIHFTVANNKHALQLAASGGNMPSGITFVNNVVKDDNALQHNVDPIDLCSNNVGDVRLYTYSGADATPSVILPVSNDSVEGSGSVRFIAPFRSSAIQNGTKFKAGDIVPVISANSVKLYAATADGTGSTVLAQLATT